MKKLNRPQYIKITREDIEGKFDLTEEALTRDSNKPQLSEEMEKQFREKFLMKGSDCTWKVYPDPEEVMAFQATALEEQRQGYIEKVEMYFGSRNIGDKHLDIQKEVLAILKKEKQL